ncbi:P-loop containing nucleoside triphosphate hydrolase protein [Kockovaella imperatae]|uniref:ATP-dependent RNA helicase n=1 Tax=Kockovaella imperatae TaxID=4999 RepID=A0A1Y1UEC7_9TREE|nr:P-loop containing nucleoside triphosphate hydrolase protein [Kockovaella imperatae]ORX35864.1 P-loop containing nucleoside triphosphate hydrolase protein [Kockovaella imperatae]
MGPSRALAVAMTVYPLRQVLVRSLHASSLNLAPVAAASSSSFSSRLSGTPASASALYGHKPPRPDDKPGKRIRYQRFAKPGGASGRRLALARPRSFSPTTYDLPPSSAPASHATPKRFDEFEVHPRMLPGVYEKLGDHPETTPIQSLAFNHFFPVAEPSQRVLLGAETGSGKTLAFLVPLMSQLKLTEGEDRKYHDDDSKYEALLPRSIILSPTHELTRQTTGLAKSLVHSMKLSVFGMSQTQDGGIGKQRGIKDIFLGTVAMTRRMLGLSKPGGDENLDKMRKAWVVPDRLDWLVIDEADVLLGRDFQEETMTVIMHLAKDRPNLNIILCTATVPPALLQLMSTHPFFASTPFTYLLSPNLHKLPSSLEARFIKFTGNVSPINQVGQHLKHIMTEDLRSRKARMEQGEDLNRSKYVIFCNTDAKVRLLGALLERLKIPTVIWTGGGNHRVHGKNGPLNRFLLEPKARAAMNSISNAEDTASSRVLVTTSILSRGLDFHPLVSAVILVDEPRDVLDFVHRAGRAGRAGRTGRVIVFGDGKRGVKSVTEKVGALAGLPTPSKKRTGRFHDSFPRRAAIRRQR